MIDNLGEIYWQLQEKELLDIAKSESNQKYIYCFGDCYTLGVGALAGRSYPEQLQEMLGDKFTVKNLGRTMIGIEKMLRFSNLFTKNITNKDGYIIVWGGGNDLFYEMDENKLFQLTLDLCDVLRQFCSKLIVLTLLPRSNLVPNRFNNARIAYNLMIKDGFDYVVDLTENDAIGKPGCEKNTQYYSAENNTHPNENGYKIVAEMVAKKVTEIYNAQ